MLLLRKTLEYDAESAARRPEGYRQVLRLTHSIKRPIASRSRSATIATNMIEYAQELWDPAAVNHSSVSKRPAPTQRVATRSSFSLRRKPRRMSQHPVGHSRDDSGIARTLRCVFILPCMTSSSSDGAPALRRHCQIGAARVSFGLRYRGSSAGARARRVPSASRCGDGRWSA